MHRLLLKSVQFFYPVVIIMLFVGCNSGEENKAIAPAANSAKQVSGSTENVTCNYYITEDDGQKMVTKFRDYLSLTGSGPNQLSTAFWIDSCVISTLIRYFNTNGSASDGVRFYFVGDEKSRLILVPTREITNAEGTSRHGNIWGSVIDGSGCGQASQYLNTRKSDAEDGMEEFAVRFRQKTPGGVMADCKIDQLSVSVWYEKCVIRAIANLVLDTSKNLNGVSALCAAHLKMEATDVVIGQKYKNQSTLILVPTKEASHKLAWEAVTPPSINVTYNEKDGAFNHGELCPKTCPPEGE